MTTGQLDQNLRRFYAEARTQKGEPYSKSTVLGFWHAIERYLNAPPYNKGLQLASDPRFMWSNQMLDAQLINLRRNGKENVTHKPAIEEGHLKQLQTSGVFSLSSPLSLLRNAWYHIVLFFCRRGSEGQRGLTTNSFKFATDAARRKFVTMANDEASKNHPGGVHDSSSNEKEARMHESAKSNDGYKVLKLFLEKINPKCSAFFQYPKSNVRPKEHDEENQQSGRVLNHKHKPQHQSDSHNPVVQCWCPWSTHHVNVRPSKWAILGTLQLAAVDFSASKLQWCAVKGASSHWSFIHSPC